jgi:hypothetical protein
MGSFLVKPRKEKALLLAWQVTESLAVILKLMGFSRIVRDLWDQSY